MELLDKATWEKGLAANTRNVIDFSLVQKLGDKVEVIILPAGQDFLWNLGDIVSKK